VGGTGRRNVPPMARTRLYCRGELEAEDFPVEDVSELLADPDAVVWVDFVAPTAADLALVSAELGLHDVAIDDALGELERPKVDRYETHLLLTAYAVGFDQASGTLTTSEVAAFVTGHALVTVRKDGAFPMDSVVRRWDEDADLARYGVPFLLWGLLDEVVDGYFDAVQQLDALVESLEDLVFDERPHGEDVQRFSFRMRKSLVLLRRVLLPVREVVNALMRHDLHVMDPAMLPYYQDVYDHVLRASEWTESLRDLITSVLETNLTIQGNRLNMIMKKVTSWAAIIAVPTAITGFYGQNVLFPGFASVGGAWSSVALIAVVSVVLYRLFKSRDWL
jgi:magnesium transporter